MKLLRNHKVTIITKKSHLYEKVGFIRKIEENNPYPYLVDVDGEQNWFNENEIERLRIL